MRGAGTRFVVEPPVEYVMHDADHGGVGVRGISEIDDLADGVGIAEELMGQVFVNDDDVRRVFAVGIGKESPAHKGECITFIYSGSTM